MDRRRERAKLRERATGVYVQKIAHWFNARFRPQDVPQTLPCAAQRLLMVRASVMVDNDLRITGAGESTASGSEEFDRLVADTLHKLVGQQIPPPPPVFPDLAPNHLSPVFTNHAIVCR